MLFVSVSPERWQSETKRQRLEVTPDTTRTVTSYKSVDMELTSQESAALQLLHTPLVLKASKRSVTPRHTGTPHSILKVSKCLYNRYTRCSIRFSWSTFYCMLGQVFLSVWPIWSLLDHAKTNTYIRKAIKYLSSGLELYRQLDFYFFQDLKNLLVADFFQGKWSFKIMCFLIC